jgi:hypothetical protein
MSDLKAKNEVDNSELFLEGNIGKGKSVKKNCRR